MLNVTVRGLTKLKKDLKVESKRQRKALTTAVKVEAFRLRGEMKKEIRKGAPGGKAFAPLTFLSRRWHEKGHSRLRPNKPLSAMARGVHYHVKDGNPLDVRVGFTGPRLSNSWKRIAKKQQEGFTDGMGDFRRRYFIHTAHRLGKRAGGRKYLFIRKSTKTFETPARSIVEPSWDAHKTEALVNIRKNFRRKMRGKRI